MAATAGRPAPSRRSKRCRTPGGQSRRGRAARTAEAVKGRAGHGLVLFGRRRRHPQGERRVGAGSAPGARADLAVAQHDARLRAAGRAPPRAAGAGRATNAAAATRRREAHAMARPRRRPPHQDIGVNAMPSAAATGSWSCRRSTLPTDRCARCSSTRLSASVPAQRSTRARRACRRPGSHGGRWPRRRWMSRSPPLASLRSGSRRKARSPKRCWRLAGRSSTLGNQRVARSSTCRGPVGPRRPARCRRRPAGRRAGRGRP